MQIIDWEIDKLISAEYNPRKLSEEQKQTIKDSINRFGLVDPVIVNTNKDRFGIIIGGHQRTKVARELGFEKMPCVELDLTLDQEKELNVRLNKNTGDFDKDLLVEFFDQEDLVEWGFENEYFEDVVTEIDSPDEEDFNGEIPTEPQTVLGDLYELNGHRVHCASSTEIDAVEKLMDGGIIDLIHSDPPYGMGKQKDGVLNDNLYNEELDQFQMDWINCYKSKTKENGSLYIWGNPKELWRLYFNGGLSEYPDITFKNHIVWDKKNIPGMKSPLMTQYPIVSESCLFFQFGEQFRGSINSEDFIEGFDPVRQYLEDEANKNNITGKKIEQLCGVQMYSHWFTKSQWTLIPLKHYETLQTEYPGSFEKKYIELKNIQKKVHEEYKKTISEERPFFDNAHEVMTDVWDYKRVFGEDRHGHATPKPTDMMVRVMKSSSRKGEIVAEPFLGSGSTLISAEICDRKCYGQELDPKYCDVIVKRWVKYMDDNNRKFTVKRNGEDITKNEWLYE